jgi:hypothetical protein
MKIAGYIFCNAEFFSLDWNIKKIQNFTLTSKMKMNLSGKMRLKKCYGTHFRGIFLKSVFGPNQNSFQVQKLSLPNVYCL